MSEIKLDKIDSLKVSELKEKLKERKMKSSGKKIELVNRLRAALFCESFKIDQEDVDDTEEEDDDDEEESIDFNDENNLSPPEVKADFKNVSNHSVLTFKDIEESIDTFSGDDKTKSVTNWIREFDDLCQLCQWTEVQKLIYARRLLRGSALLFIKHQRNIKTWVDMAKALKKEFRVQVNSKLVHRKLEARKKLPDENFREYYYKMYDIASSCKMDKQSLFLYVIDGIEDIEANKAILYGAVSYEDFLQKLSVYEEMKANCSKVQYDSKRKEKKDNNSDNDKIKSEITVRCFNCGSKQHVVDKCPEKSKGPKCFKCNEYGHIATNCKSICLVNVSDESKYVDSKPSLNIRINDLHVKALLDSGSDLSLIALDVYEKLGSPVLGSSRINLQGIGPDLITTLGGFNITIFVDEISYELEMHVIPDLGVTYKTILGRNFFQQINVTICGNKISNMHKLMPDVCNVESFEPPEGKEVINNEFKEVIKKCENIETNETGVTMKQMLTEKVPVNERARRPSPEAAQLADRQSKERSSKEMIRPSTSDYAIPTVIVPKKTGVSRICVDYRGLKKIRFELNSLMENFNGKPKFKMRKYENAYSASDIDEDDIRDEGDTSDLDVEEDNDVYPFDVDALVSSSDDGAAVHDLEDDGLFLRGRETCQEGRM